MHSPSLGRCIFFLKDSIYKSDSNRYYSLKSTLLTNDHAPKLHQSWEIFRKISMVKKKDKQKKIETIQPKTDRLHVTMTFILRPLFVKTFHLITI